MTTSELSRVAPPGECDSATNSLVGATTVATPVQHTSLKALAHKALARNTACNTPATGTEMPCENRATSKPESVACTRDRLLSIARELGSPDALVLDLPPDELMATAGQYAVFTAEKGEELGRKLLVFYLRSLAGIEPALPGSLAARESPRP